jgi:hypothetical protein
VCGKPMSADGTTELIVRRGTAGFRCDQQLAVVSVDELGAADCADVSLGMLLVRFQGEELGKGTTWTKVAQTAKSTDKPWKFTFIEHTARKEYARRAKSAKATAKAGGKAGTKAGAKEGKKAGGKEGKKAGGSGSERPRPSAAAAAAVGDEWPVLDNLEGSPPLDQVRCRRTTATFVAVRCRAACPRRRSGYATAAASWAAEHSQAPKTLTQRHSICTPITRGAGRGARVGCRC